MIVTPPAIPGFSFTKESYTSLVARYLALPNWTAELLGQSHLGSDIYGFSLGDSGKPAMYVEGNIHGYHEWRTSWWVSEFMRLLDDPSTLDAATCAAILYLKEKYQFYFIPSVNPDGYINNTYGNGAGVSISENFDYNWTSGIHTPPSPEYRGPAAWSEPESCIVRDKILEIAPASVLCCHTWSSTSAGYMTRYPQQTGDQAGIVDMFANVHTALGYDPAAVESRLSDKLLTGSAYNWASTQIGSLGRPIIGQVWESGGGLSVEDQSRVGMTGILYHMLMVDEMLLPYGATTLVADAISWGPVRVGGLTYNVASVDVLAGSDLQNVWTAT